VVCEACTTRLQGRNFCATCLSERIESGRPDTEEDSLPARLLVGLLTVGSATLLCGLVTGLGFLLYLAG
jgi:hypothetical protein